MRMRSRNSRTKGEEATPAKKKKKKLDDVESPAKHLERKFPPRLDQETSRSQVLGRTGFKGPGQSVAFQYGAGKIFPSYKAAMKAAKDWLISERIRQGIGEDE